ncbi:MAG: family 65 glycosyl hydrolase [Flavobacteriales bacterium CG_4_9_14_3_um_filter_40_17]|nr:MAG: family 65 glycosyl hydrolase [Flavobacteriales bacterium CG_4_9_14_3_um_filter_40_17]
MNLNYIKPDEWSIIEEGFDPSHVKASESLFSIGNGAMGQRANFEETYTGKTFQGSYIAGIYYPDKTRVGWWKNGYPEYFAKVLNAPNWIGIRVFANDAELDLNTATKIKDYRRELNMREGKYERSFEATLPNGLTVRVNVIRFLSIDLDELGAINYEVTPVNQDATITFKPYLDAGIENEDTNWEERFWETLEVKSSENAAFIVARTKKTHFHVCTFMHNTLLLNGKSMGSKSDEQTNAEHIEQTYSIKAAKGEPVALVKFAGYTVSLNHPNDKLVEVAKKIIKKADEKGFEGLLQLQKESWEKIWDMADITIEGDVSAQQGIRFNIFQLNQTYLGKDPRLNIGPKGFTGEKYGGSTYWDTEAYCLPFYMATKDQQVARSLLTYRYNHLQKAIENAEKLGFKNGAALYPMVTMNGEECHNEWEITFEEIHRNGAMIYAIRNYLNFTGDYSYIPEKGLEVMIGVARFWAQRATFSTDKNKYMVLGVTGPNEYENNVNNNWFTNYLAKWCISYALENLEKTAKEYPSDYQRILDKTKLAKAETDVWKKVSDNMYFPYSEKHQVFLQQDNFLDKELIPVSQLTKAQRPINQKWSWDRILRSCYIKQADTLQGMYVFEEDFRPEVLERHFDFYEPFTVHESSLSPCVHAILAASLGRMDQAYEFYLRTSRLDLDDYNHEVHEGCHITSMAGTWMSIVEGFGGMRVRNGQLHFRPQIPKQWKGYSFKVNFHHQIVKVSIHKDKTQFSLEGKHELTVFVNGKAVVLRSNETVTV